MPVRPALRPHAVVPRMPAWQAVGVVNSGSLDDMCRAIERMDESPAAEKVLWVPDEHISAGVAAFRLAGHEGWVRGLSGRKEWHVPGPRLARKAG